MTMELTNEQLFAAISKYLPYGLQWQNKDGSYIFEFDGCDAKHRYFKISYYASYRNYEVDFKVEDIGDFLPLLRPLSSMTKEEQRELQDSGAVFWNPDKERFEFDFNDKTKKRGLYAIDYLLSRHFDLYGLIEAGYAIDKSKTADNDC